uniref:Uncharacterized protein n=1 Tax=Arundo donax TaxID=35708 RepID=A0A0A9GVU5_ARUDO
MLRSPNSGGMAPVRLFSAKLRSCKLAMPPNAAGMPPDMRLPSICRRVILVHWPQSSDSRPVSSFPEMSR